MSTSREELPVLDPFEMLLDAARYAERIKPEWSRAAKRSVAQARLAATPKAGVDMTLPEIPDDDADFTPDIARKIIGRYQQIVRSLTLPSVLDGVDQESIATKPSPSRAEDSATETAPAHWFSFRECRCEQPMVKCDHTGIRCTLCGEPARVQGMVGDADADTIAPDNAGLVSGGGR